MHPITKPRIFTDNLDRYAPSARLFQGIPGIDRDRRGTLWATWYSGGLNEGPDNFVVLARSDDGEQFADPVVVIDPPGITRAFDPCLWQSPDGRLWWFWGQSDHWCDGRMGVWATTIESADRVTVGRPRRIADGVMMNKPTVLADGQWLLPIALWDADISNGYFGDKKNDPLAPLRTAHVYATRDGETFERRGGVAVPQRSFDEHMVVQRRGGVLAMYVRTHYGLAESVSTDGGRSWSPGTPSAIGGPDSRFFIRRLRSGRLLLVNHRNFTGRSHLTASLSDDDGATWFGHLLLDERTGVSYPDGFEGDDGHIRVIYDRGRTGEREILMARVTEGDIATGVAASPSSKLKMIVSCASRRGGAEDGPLRSA